MEPSVGTVGDSYDSALAESVIGLFKTEVIRRRRPWRGVEDVEFATLEWVAWFNRHRLLEPIGYGPPVEYEEHSYQLHQTLAGGRESTNPVSGKPGAVHRQSMLGCPCEPCECYAATRPRVAETVKPDCCIQCHREWPWRAAALRGRGST
jgi:hypothetical protein